MNIKTKKKGECMNKKRIIQTTVVNCKEVAPRGSGNFILRLKAKEFLNLNPEPGQFSVLEPLKKTSVMPRPFSITWTYRDEFWFFIQTVGDSDSNTRHYANLKNGNKLKVSHPRGKGFVFNNKTNNYVLVGGGIGVAALTMIARKLVNDGKNVKVIIGVKYSKEIIGMKLFKKLGIKPIITVENENYEIHKKGRVTDSLKEIFEQDKSKMTVISCGPKLMLEAVHEMSKLNNQTCFVAVEEIMACGGTGNCVGCSIKMTDGGYVSICKEGPIFPACEIDWGEFIKKAKPMVSAENTSLDPMGIVLFGKNGRMLELSSPLIPASGCLSLGDAQNNPYLVKTGALTTKGIMIGPRDGNPQPRVCEVISGILNSIGLAGIGVDRFIKEELHCWLSTGKQIIVNIAGGTVEEYIEIAWRLSSFPIAGFEINISCPNMKQGCLAFGTNPNITKQIVEGVREVAPDKFIIVKLTPAVTDIVEIAKAAVEGGADAISLINTVPAMAIDIYSRKTRLGNKTGGLSGSAIKPIGVYLVNKVYEANLGVPIIGMGGIINGEDVIEYILAGANAVEIGTGWFKDNSVFNNSHAFVLKYLKKYGIGITDLVGKFS